MEFAELVQTLVDNGISVVLAGVVIYWYRIDSKERIKDAKDRTEEEQARTEEQRNDKLLLIEALQDNTRAMASLENCIRDLADVRNGVGSRKES